MLSDRCRADRRFWRLGIDCWDVMCSVVLPALNSARDIQKPAVFSDSRTHNGADNGDPPIRPGATPRIRQPARRVGDPCAGRILAYLLDRQ